MKFEKGEKKLDKRRIRTWVDRVKRSTTHILPSAPVEVTTDDCLL